jgi:hypothetical protein
MKTTKQLGIWMDHSMAHLTEFKKGTMVSTIIEAEPKTQANEQDLYYHDESHQLNKAQNKLTAYYKKLSDAILDYEEVLLFGPTDAKNELSNLLKDDHLFNNIKITAKPTDKMTEYHQHIFIKEFFHPSVLMLNK